MNFIEYLMGLFLETESYRVRVLIVDDDCEIWQEDNKT